MSPDGGAGGRGPVHTTPAGRRFQLGGGGGASAEDVEVLAAAIDRYATLLAEQQLGPWTTAHRAGIGVRAWAAGSRWATSNRSRWGRDV